MARMETGTGRPAMQQVPLPTLMASRKKSLESPPRLAQTDSSKARRASAPDSGFAMGRRGSDTTIIPPQLFNGPGSGRGLHAYAVPRGAAFEDGPRMASSAELTSTDEEPEKESRRHPDKDGKKKKSKRKKRTDSGNIRKPPSLDSADITESSAAQQAMFSMHSNRANLGLTPAHHTPMTPAQIEYLSAMEAHTRARYDEPTDTPCSVAQSRPFTGFSTPLGGNSMLSPSRSLLGQDGNVFVSVSPIKPSPIKEQSSEDNYSSEEDGLPQNRPALAPFNPYAKSSKRRTSESGGLGGFAKSGERRGSASRRSADSGQGSAHDGRTRRSSAALGGLEAQALPKHHKHQELVQGQNRVPPCSEMCCEYSVFVFLWVLLYAAMIVGGAKMYSGIINPSSAKAQGAPVILDDFSASLQDIISTIIVIVCGLASVASETVEIVRGGGCRFTITIVTKVVDVAANVVRIIVGAALLNADTVYIIPSMFFVSSVMESLHMLFMHPYDLHKDRAVNPCMCILEGVNYLASYFLIVEQAFVELAYIIVFTFLSFAELSRLYNVEDVQKGVILQNFIFASIGMNIIFLIITVASDIRRRNWGRCLAVGTGLFFAAVAGGLLVLVFVWAQFVDLLTTVQDNAGKSQIGQFVTGANTGNPRPGDPPAPTPPPP